MNNNATNGISENGEVPGEIQIGDGGEPGKKPNKRLSVERIYQKKTQLEHILLRPDTYIGSVEPVTEMMWVYDGDEEGMVQRQITYVPGLYKIFDEILVNAADNKQRDPKMDCIKVDIDEENNVVSIWNNGKGIPVVNHKDENMFVPTMIFGHLLTSSNYNDEDMKVTGGRNGYGAKLCNIFSTKFTVETASKDYKKSFKQTWGNNMTKTSEPKIKESSDDFTKITFSPDLKKFKMDSLDRDIVALMSRRAYDVAASTRGVKVYLNGKRLSVKSFKDYVEQYLKGKEDEAGRPIRCAYENVSDRWEVAVAVSDKGFQQMSFVNSIATTKGGRHVDYVSEMVIKHLIETIKKKNKGGMAVKPFQIKTQMWLFINCLIVNPTFDSQTKENMTLQVKSFGSRCAPSEKFYGAAMKCGIIENVLAWAKFKAQTQLNKACSSKKQNKLKGVPKLEDANDAGTKNSINCTLILTEGDSAKSLAVSGLGVVGRDKYGVFPLKGKILNVREATHKQILENAEINNIIKIMGLQYKKKYESVDDLRTLRYGKLMIMTDQDQDGSHIKGLLINFFHHNWPSLLRLPFLEEFITPIVKATKGKEEFPFYSIPEFEEWKKDRDNWHTYKIKYYKGLGTSTSKEAKEYFSDMTKHRIRFRYQGQQDDHSITMAFSKKCVDMRKEWLSNWMEEGKRRRELGLPEVYLYEKDTRNVNFADFINKELVLFSNLDNERSIPSLVDGLKPGQRKVLYTCIKRNDKREIKVAQLAGSVAEHSSYHHGEVSLMGAIINLAQNFVGSNNINILQPIGQFGTRLQGGKDAASPRYIFTMLSPVTRHIFHPHDDSLLRHLYDDNQKIEPEWYCPIIPMVLVNGADGIGTGWMTKIQNYNPREIVSNLKRMLDGEDVLPMTPWFKNFRGTIEPLDHQRFVINGEISVISDDKVEITELPIRTWTQAYKETVMEPMLHGSEKTPPTILDYKEYHTDTTVKFVVSMSSDKLYHAEEYGLHKTFKLQTTLSATSMVLFDQNGCLRKYDSVEDIMREFFNIRLTYYEKRKSYLEGMLQAESSKLSNQARFILEKCDNTLIIENKKKKDMVEELHRKGFDSDPVKSWKLVQDRAALLEEEANDTEEEDDQLQSGLDYDYLMGMSMWNLTKEKKEELLKKKDEKLQEYHNLQKKSPSDLWKMDLETFLEKLDSCEAAEEEEAAAVGQAIKSLKMIKTKRPKKIQEETLPSPIGRKVEPKIDVELKRKVEKLAVAKENKVKRAKKTYAEDIKDEFDVMIETDGNRSLSERLGNSPDKVEKKIKGEKKKGEGLKQSKLLFKAKKESDGSPKKKGSKKPGRNPWSDSDDEMDVDSDALSDAIGDVDVAPRVRDLSSQRAAASKAKKYTFDSDSESEEEPELYDNVNVIAEESEKPQYSSLEENTPVRPKMTSKSKVKDDEDGDDDDDDEENAIDISDTDSEFNVKIPKRIGSDSESEYEPEKKKKDKNASKKPETTVGPSSDLLFDSLLAGSGGSATDGQRIESDHGASVSDDNDAMSVKSSISVKSKDDVLSIQSTVSSKSKEKAPAKKRPLLKKKSEDKPKQKVQKVAPKKKKTFSDSEDDMFVDVKPKKKKLLQQKASSESDAASDDDLVPRSASTRTRKVVNYNYDEESEEEFCE